MNKLITVIGGSGFVGTRLIDLLGEGNCLNIDKRESKKYPKITKIADIRDKKKLYEVFDKNTSTVILLAAEHSDSAPKSLYFDVNVDGTRNVIECMSKLGINNIIFTSSVAVYGLNKKNPDENHPVDPYMGYGTSKLEAEKVLGEWQQLMPDNRWLTVIRPTVIFGERNRGNVYKLLKQITGGRFLMVGNGSNKKSMAYVGNVAAFLKYCVENQNKHFNLFNYIDKPDLSMNELVKVIEKSLKTKVPSFRLPYWFGMLGGYFFDFVTFISRKKMPISSIRIEKFCATTQFNSDKVLSTGFSAPFTLKEGLSKTLKFEFGSTDN